MNPNNYKQKLKKITKNIKRINILLDGSYLIFLFSLGIAFLFARINIKEMKVLNLIVNVEEIVPIGIYDALTIISLILIAISVSAEVNKKRQESIKKLGRTGSIRKKLFLSLSGVTEAISLDLIFIAVAFFLAINEGLKLKLVRYGLLAMHIQLLIVLFLILLFVILDWQFKRFNRKLTEQTNIV